MGLVLALPLLLAAPQGTYDPDPELTAGRWLVVYNANWPDEDGNGVNDSLEVAEHWMRKRRVPADRLVALKCTTGTDLRYDGETAWEELWDEVIVPLRAAAGSADADQVLGFVFCYGVPYELKLSGWTKRGVDTTVARLWQLGARDRHPYTDEKTEDFYADLAPGVEVSPGRFDPVVHREDDMRTYLVARLDGVDKEHAIELVDMALYGDVYISTEPGHYLGRAYCDTRYGAYSKASLDANYPYSHWTYGEADKALAYGRGYLTGAGFRTHWEPNLTEIGEPGATFEDGTSALTAPKAMVYEGWYNHDTYNDVWEWMVGSFGTDLNSNSIANLRRASPGTFVGEALRNGLTAGVGALDEPYTEGHPYPEVFAYYMLKGFPFAEAARISDTRLLWTNLYVGDPLYQPFRPGKVPQLDLTPPPPAQLDALTWAGSAGSWTLETSLDTTGLMPDLIELQVRWSTSPGGPSTFADAIDDRPRLFHEVPLTGLPADETVYYQAIGTDPVGNVTTGPTMVMHTGLETKTVLADVSADATTVSVGTPVALEVAFGAVDGFEAIQPASVRLTATHLGYVQHDIMPLFFGDRAEQYHSADDTVRVGRLKLRDLQPGTYTIEVTANTAGGVDQDSIVITVQ